MTSWRSAKIFNYIIILKIFCKIINILTFIAPNIFSISQPIFFKEYNISMNNILKIKLKLFIKKLILFLIFGVITNILGGIIYFTLVYFKINTILSLSFAYVIGVIFSIFLNKKITFKIEQKSKKIWLKFILLHCLCYLICQATNETIIFLLEGDEYVLFIGYVFSVALAAITNFIGMYVIIKYESRILNLSEKT